MPIVVRRDSVVVNNYRKRSRRLVQTRTPVTIPKSRKEKRSGFAGDASQSQQNGGHDPTVGSGDHNSSDGGPFAGAKGHRALAQGARHSEQKLFSAAQGDRDHHQTECESAGQSGKMLKRKYYQSISED